MSSRGSHVDAMRGSHDAEGLRIAILVARFNQDITDRLLAGARQCLADHGAAEDGIDVLYVPGAWELPQAAGWIVQRGAHDLVVTLGCVIRGETPHFQYLSQEATRGLGAVARGASVPVVFGVLTTDDHAQAMARAADGPSNKGYEVTLAALEMAAVKRKVEEL